MSRWKKLNRNSCMFVHVCYRKAFLWFKNSPSGLFRDISVDSSADFSGFIGGDLRRFGWIVGTSELEMRNTLKSFLRFVIF